MSATNYPISKVVQVDIVKSLIVPSIEDFGLLCLFSADPLWLPPTRFVIYGDFSEVIVDWLPGTPEYIFAQSFFSQSPEPVELMMAKVDLITESYVEAIAATYAEHQFYALAFSDITGVDDATVLAVAQYAQTQLLVLHYQTSDNSYALATQIKDLGLNRTTVSFYEAINTTSRMDAAIAGFALTRAPGTFNLANQGLIGVFPTTQTIANIESGIEQSVNFYISIARTPVIRDGKVSGADDGILYYDERTGIDWIQITLQQQVFQAMVSLDKIPYTDGGMAIIAGIIKNVLDNAVKLSILAALPAPTVTYLPVAQVPPSQEQARIAPTFYFTATLAGAVNYIKISGTLTG